LIEYDPKYESLMSWVFGQTFVCTDGEAALKLCYNPEIKRKAITLDGDVYDPMGTISGGIEYEYER
jgi:structural maintenance of chromosome 2